MNLIDKFKTLYQVHPQLEDELQSMIRTKVFLKGSTIFEPGAYLKYIYFIEQGFTRIFYYKNNRDITHLFFGTDSFSTGIESVFYNKPSMFGFQALVESRISFLPFHAIQKIAETDIVMNQIIQKVLLDNLINLSNRFYNSQFQTALQRYELLVQQNPTLLQNASLGHIASFLGISQQTLSVIRGQK